MSFQIHTVKFGSRENMAAFIRLIDRRKSEVDYQLWNLISIRFILCNEKREWPPEVGLTDSQYDRFKEIAALGDITFHA